MKRTSTLFSILLGLVILGCPQPGSEPDEGGDLALFEDRLRQLEERIDPLEVEAPEAPPPAPESRRELEPSASAIAADADQPPRRLEIYFFDLGQADSMLAIGPAPERRTLLFDLGEARGSARENYHRVAQRILDLTGDTHLDYLIVSHYHDDHTGDDNDGVAGLLEWIAPQFTVGLLIDVGEESEAHTASSRPTYRRFRANAAEWTAAGGPVGRRETPRFGSDQIDLGPGVVVEILAAAGRAGDNDRGALARVLDYDPDRYQRAPANENDLSIAIELTYGEFELFTAGDLNGYDPADFSSPPLFTPRQFRRPNGSIKRETYTNVESHLVSYWQNSGRETDVEVYRANHHGSRYSTSPSLLQALDPEVVLFSTGGGHGHPESSIIARSAETATLLATTWIASESFQSWQAAGGRRIGEIAIVVEESGSYTIAGEARSSFTSDQEAANEDAG